MALQGGVVSISCKVQVEGRRCIYLYRDRRMIYNVTSESTEKAVFTMANVNRESGGNYRCICDQLSPRRVRSKPSDAIRLTVLDVKAPLSTLHPSSAEVIEGGNLSMTCTAATQQQCFFYDNSDDQYMNHHLAVGRSNVTISVVNISVCDVGNYTCQCLIEVNGVLAYSARSNLMEVTVIGRVESMTKASQTGSTCSLVLAISLSCTAFILLILISAILGVCLSKKRITSDCMSETPAKKNLHHLPNDCGFQMKVV
uniref:contactin-2-like n=1 Tax=Pristiophorus japonicus TaxID=55135 RepID=UPI00398ED663